MSIDLLEERINKLKQEQMQLATNHEQMVGQLNRSQARFHQITGAIAELESLKKSFNGTTPQ